MNISLVEIQRWSDSVDTKKLLYIGISKKN